MARLQYKEFGVVTRIRGCIISTEGLENCISGQIVRCGEGTSGIVIGFDEDEAQILVVKQRGEVKTGDRVEMTLEPFNVPVGKNFVGRIVNPLGEPLDNLGTLEPDEYLPVFGEPPSVLDRSEVNRTLETGIKIADSMIPIGKGQRQLILGDKMTGKTTAGTDAILNQKGKDVICIYCCIGKSKASLDRVVNLFKANDAFEYSMIVAAIAGTSPGLQYLVPYVGCSLGEYFMYKSGHVLAVFDDFTKHAWAYRELSLILGRPPGRESYPGDVFYLHSRMIERAASLSEEHGNGSMTFLPIVETLEGDVTGYIVTNLISMTDGQLVFNAGLFAEGFKPAVDIGLSVSRIGTKAQWPALKKLCKTFKLGYIQYRELLKMSTVQTGDQTDEVKKQMRQGEVLTKLLIQVNDEPMDLTEEVVIFYGYTKEIILDLSDMIIDKIIEGIFKFAEEKYSRVLKEIRETQDLSEENDKELGNLYKDFIEKMKHDFPEEFIEEEAEEEKIKPEDMVKETEEVKKG